MPLFHRRTNEEEKGTVEVPVKRTRTSLLERMARYMNRDNPNFPDPPIVLTRHAIQKSS